MYDTDRPSGRYYITALFCDIRGFTSLFDERDPLEALSFANSVLGELGRVVESCNGTIDKFLGDGLLAHFGLNGTETHADDACRCAINLRDKLEVINSQRYINDQMTVSLGVGIHSGFVAAGVVRASQKVEYTIFGSTVNVASRVEGLTKFFGVDCLISEATVQHLKSEYMLQKMPLKELRGVAVDVPTYWLLPTN